ncbi:hypothetical protein PSQ19_14270 [Devosia algicola]|uniref:Uncharacterized protein n=1 Tax=Devosia algicola TaxID=3026418 RepID=A0ABY7YKN5_9HYPH|nr:hypothetical protein [Devosia algicola]WDR01868.1 hypothetical protein PSQ19_14270 [Devosia algicola]
MGGSLNLVPTGKIILLFGTLAHRVWVVTLRFRIQILERVRGATVPPGMQSSTPNDRVAWKFWAIARLKMVLLGENGAVLGNQTLMQIHDI